MLWPERAANFSNIIVDVSRGTSSLNLFPLEKAVPGGIALVGGVLGIALVNARKRETV
jgi:hypothetical protein